MKKALVAAFAGVLAAVSYAGMDNVVITFGTTGPDKYADGTTVLDGESYALVWTPAGSTFQGFTADGAAVLPSKVVVKAPVAEGGKCPPVQFEIEEEYAKTNFVNGTWGVYLLDTRLFAADKNGNPQMTGAFGSALNGYGAVSSLNAGGDKFASVGSTSTVSVGVAPADKQEVKIRDIKLVDDKVYIYVSGTVSSASYGLEAGAAPDALGAPEAAGIGNTSGDLIIIRDKKAGGEFFKVNRK